MEEHFDKPEDLSLLATQFRIFLTKNVGEECTIIELNEALDFFANPVRSMGFFTLSAENFLGFENGLEEEAKVAALHVKKKNKILNAILTFCISLQDTEVIFYLKNHNLPFQKTTSVKVFSYEKYCKYLFTSDFENISKDYRVYVSESEIHPVIYPSRKNELIYDPTLERILKDKPEIVLLSDIIGPEKKYEEIFEKFPKYADYQDSKDDQLKIIKWICKTYKITNTTFVTRTILPILRELHKALFPET